jgi:hypothetical protein
VPHASNENFSCYPLLFEIFVFGGPSEIFLKSRAIILRHSVSVSFIAGFMFFLHGNFSEVYATKNCAKIYTTIY